MGMLEQRVAPNLPLAPEIYDRRYMDEFANAIRLFFSGLNGVQVLSLAGILFDLGTLPTEADVANLRVGTVYRDSTASNVLKVKT